MHLEKFGTGKKIYFGLHGWSGSHLTFAPLVEHVPQDAALYAVDMPGYGRSPLPEEWNLEAIYSPIVNTISNIDAPKFTLIGSCSGALIGLLVARQVRERIERMVLIDPFAFTPWYFRVFVETSFGRIAYNMSFANPIGRWITNLSLRKHRASKTDLTESFKEINHDVSFNYLALLAKGGGIAQFREFNMPVDIVYGAKTFGAVKQSIDLWRNLWPHARCTELAGAGHLPIEEATEQLSEIIFRKTGP